MTSIGARTTAAVIRSVGIDARATPPSDDRTLELGALFSSGEECYPQKVTFGDFLRIVHRDDFDPDKAAFFMPTAEGPCRFGQYAPYLRQVLDEMGHTTVPVLSPTSQNSYAGIGEFGGDTFRNVWRGLVAGDILRKMLLKTRPYETQVGAADKALEEGIGLLIGVLETPGLSTSDRLVELVGALTKARALFRAVPAVYTRDKPLIAVVGEIYCRLNTFANRDAVRQIEAHGGEAWLSDISEWVWYTNWSQRDKLQRAGKKFSLSMLGAVLKNRVQKGDEHKLLAPFAEDFVGCEEPHDVYRDVLEPGWPYLPADGALGEMVLSTGKAIYVHGKGADGVIDISPFACMNGIVSEAVYHRISSDCDDMPIRNFYFDSSSSNMSRDMEIFMELGRGYRRRKTAQRKYPSYYEKSEE
jgi:predicted nucleotide-binding protein (sugar kinase/HSP70/actin superfamily)